MKNYTKNIPYYNGVDPKKKESSPACLPIFNAWFDSRLNSIERKRIIQSRGILLVALLHYINNGRKKIMFMKIII